MNLLSAFFAACWADGHEWEEKGNYLICVHCGNVKK